MKTPEQEAEVPNGKLIFDALIDADQPDWRAAHLKKRMEEVRLFEITQQFSPDTGIGLLLYCYYDSDVRSILTTDAKWSQLMTMLNEMQDTYNQLAAPNPAKLHITRAYDASFAGLF